ncbi:MAG: hypothetical protein M5U09_13140 [Gammaproteobacteria bacterium]|nr:hypothetical protein [Gammaproteobacteria bacterium]
MTLQQSCHRGPGNTQFAGDVDLPAMARGGAAQQVVLGPGECVLQGRDVPGRRSRRAGEMLARQIGDADEIRFRQHEAAFEDVLKLAHVARIVVTAHEFERIAIDCTRGAVALVLKP